MKPNEPSQTTRTFFGASAGVFVSRLSGLVRTQVINAVFGATLATDAFYLAYRFPNALRELFADGALSAAFTKTLVTVQHSEGQFGQRRLVSQVTGVFFIVTTAIAILGVLYAEPFMHIIAGEALSESRGQILASQLFRLLIFYLPLTMLSAIAMAQLSIKGQGFRAMAASAFFNLGTIGGALFLPALLMNYRLPAVGALAIGTLLGGIFQFLYQAWPLISSGEFPAPRFVGKEVWLSPHIIGIFRLMGPRILGQGAMTFALLINSHFATGISVKTISYITVAQTLIQLPVGLFGVASGFAALPSLSKHVTERQFDGFCAQIWQSLHQASWLSTCTVGIFTFLAGPLAVVLFSHGQFTVLDGLNTGLAVCAYSLGIVFSVSSRVLIQGYYALDQTRQILINAVVYLALTAILTPILATAFGLVGLGLSSSICAGIEFLLNLYFLHRNLMDKEKKPLLSQRQVGAIVALVTVAAMSSLVGLLIHQQLYLQNLVTTGKLGWWTIAFVGGLFSLVGFTMLTWKFGPKMFAQGLLQIFRKFRVR